MRRISYNPMIEGISGGLRTKQTGKLTFGGKSAYDLEDGTKADSAEFKPIIIGQQGLVGARAGKQWFAIKTRAAATGSALSKLTMAILGGGNAIKLAVLKLDNFYQALIIAFQVVKDNYPSFSTFVWAGIKTALREKAASITWEGVSVIAKNPWNVRTGNGVEIMIPKKILVKFAPQLCAIKFIVDGIAFYTNFTVVDGFLSGDLNNGDFTAESGTGNLMYKGQIVYNTDGEAVTENDTITNGDVYTTTPPNA